MSDQAQKAGEGEPWRPKPEDEALVSALIACHQTYVNLRETMNGHGITSLMVREREFRDECAKLFRDHSMDLLIRLAHIPRTIAPTPPKGQDDV